MGKKIDGFVLSVLAAGGFYLYFYRAFEIHAISFLLAALAFLLLHRLLRKTARLAGNTACLKKRRIRRLAGGTLMRIACADAQEAKACLNDLVRGAYGEEYTMEILQMHPSSTLQAENIFEIWKKHRSEDQLVLCATCNCSPEARMMAASLRQPRLAILDAGPLSQLIAEHPEGIFADSSPEKHAKVHLRRIAALLFRRRNAPKCLIFSVTMLVLYLLGGNLFYLGASILLLFAFLASMHKRSRPAKLF